MLDYLTSFFHVIQGYISFLFSLQFLPGVSIGSVFLVSLVLYVIVKLFWPRG